MASRLGGEGLAVPKTHWRWCGSPHRLASCFMVWKGDVTALAERDRSIQASALITVSEFAELAHLSRRQIDRLRRRRLPGFPKEYELGSGDSKYRRCPRFKLVEVQRWLESRALW
jgi:predicted DNA-binding transcriptional regulator AlpA